MCPINGSFEPSPAHLTITPTDGNDLKEGQEHDGHDGGVMVHQLEDVDPHLEGDARFRDLGPPLGYSASHRVYLHDARDSKQEGHAADRKHKELLPLENFDQTVVELIHETGHHHLNHRKLTQNKTGLNTAVGFGYKSDLQLSYLAVQPQAQQHEEKHDGPELSHRHVGKGLRVNHENQSWTWGHVGQSTPDPRIGLNVDKIF